MATARVPRMTGAFHGAMPTQTPAAWRMPIASEPGLSDGMTSPDDLRGHRRRLAQHVRRQHHVEACPGRRGAGLLDHQPGELADLGGQHVGGLEQQRPPLARPRLRPRRKGCCRGCDRRLDIGERRSTAARVAVLPVNGSRRSKDAPSAAGRSAPSINNPISMTISLALLVGDRSRLIPKATSDSETENLGVDGSLKAAIDRNVGAVDPARARPSTGTAPPARCRRRFRHGRRAQCRCRRGRRPALRGTA